MQKAERQPRFGVVLASAFAAAVTAGVLAKDEEIAAVVGVAVVTLGAGFDALRTGAAATNPGPLRRESRPVLFWAIVGCWLSAGTFMLALLILELLG